MVYVVRCRNDDFFIGTGTVTVRSFGLLQVVGASVQTLNIELTILARDHLNAFTLSAKVARVSAVIIHFELDLIFIMASFIAVQTEAGARQHIIRVIIIVILGVVQLVGVHTDFACGSMIKGCVDSGIVGILEKKDRKSVV